MVRTRLRVRDRVMVRVSLWIWWQMETAAELVGTRGMAVALYAKGYKAALHAAIAI